MPKINSRPVREARRRAAEERQTRYDTLTTEQKIAQAESRPGSSKRELKRLAK